MTKRYREDSEESNMSTINPLEKLRSYRKKKVVDSSLDKQKQLKKKAKTSENVNNEIEEIEQSGPSNNSQLSYSQKKQKIRETDELNEKIEIILSYVNEIKLVNDKVTELEKKDEIVTEAVLKNSDRITYLEIEARKKNILVKGIQLHSNALNNKETREQTEETVQWFLDTIECNVKPTQCVRFVPTKRAIEAAQKLKKRVAPIIKIECLSERAKAQIFVLAPTSLVSTKALV